MKTGRSALHGASCLANIRSSMSARATCAGLVLKATWCKIRSSKEYFFALVSGFFFAPQNSAIVASMPLMIRNAGENATRNASSSESSPSQSHSHTSPTGSRTAAAPPKASTKNSRNNCMASFWSAASLASSARLALRITARERRDTATTVLLCSTIPHRCARTTKPTTRNPAAIQGIIPHLRHCRFHRFHSCPAYDTPAGSA